MRLSLLAAAAASLLALAARADDTKPPAIADVRSGLKAGKVTVEAKITDDTGVLSAVVHHRGAAGKVEDTPMVKNDFDDVFHATFAGGGDTVFWLESTDLLGNGPATYGSAAKPVAVGGGTPPVVAKKEPAPAKQPAAKKARTKHAAAAPVIEHKRPSGTLVEGQAVTLRARIRSDAPVTRAIALVTPEGGEQQVLELKHGAGDTYEVTLPPALAKGSVEYYLAARSDAGSVKQGDGSAVKPYTLTFHAATAPKKSEGPYLFSHDPLYRVPPGEPVLIRAQVVPATEEGQAPELIEVLFRGNDGADQALEMVRDETGGYGGYKATLPPQDEGALYYQVVACGGDPQRCAADTGSARRWHAVSVSAQAGAPRPAPLDAISTKAPVGLPE